MKVQNSMHVDALIQKHKTESVWNQNPNFVPRAGEFIIYDPDENNTDCRMKIGDGVKAVTELSFFKQGNDGGETGDSTGGTSDAIVLYLDEEDKLWKDPEFTQKLSLEEALAGFERGIITITSGGTSRVRPISYYAYYDAIPRFTIISSESIPGTGQESKLVFKNIEAAT